MRANRRKKAIRTAGLALLEQIRWAPTPPPSCVDQKVAFLREGQPATVPFVLINGTKIIVHVAWLELAETLEHRLAGFDSVQSYDLKFHEVEQFNVVDEVQAKAANKVRPFTVVSRVNSVCVLRFVRARMCVVCVAQC